MIKFWITDKQVTMVMDGVQWLSRVQNYISKTLFALQTLQNIKYWQFLWSENKKSITVQELFEMNIVISKLKSVKPVTAKSTGLSKIHKISLKRPEM